MQGLIFDLDGTLIDSVFQHAIAWQRALARFGLAVPAWEIHRRIGMSGRLLVKGLAMRHGSNFDESTIEALETAHADCFRETASTCAPLPGARALLAYLRSERIAHGIATSGKRSEIGYALDALGLDRDACIVDGSMSESAKPEPDLFVLCRRQLDIDASQCLIVGDAVWDVHAARRAGILAVGLTSGGSGRAELYDAGAMQVYDDPAGLALALADLGFDV